MSRPESERQGRRPDRGLASAAGGSSATRETLQPSLWDRLVDDMPGLETEIDAMRRSANAEIGTERVQALLGGSVRAIEADHGLSAEQKQKLQRLAFQTRRRDELQTLNVVVSNRVLREAVRRDIEALFNTERYEATPLRTEWEAEHFDDSILDLADFPEVRRSVVNYGVPPFSGRSSRDFDRDELAREIRAVLGTFEPRLKQGATKVEVTLGDKTSGVRIEIDAVLITTPTPERMRLRTTINLENGKARTEFRNS